MNLRVKTIIYECDHSGHRLDYVGYLICWITNNNVDFEDFLFIITPELLNSLNENGYSTTKVNIQLLTNTYKYSKYRPLLLQRDLKSYISYFPSLETLIILNFDLFQYSALIFNISKTIRIRSIWFRPFPRIENKSFKTRLVKVLKTVWFNLIALKYGSRLNLYILNDHEGAEILNRILITSNKIFRSLPDPIDINRKIEADVLSLRKKNNIALDSHVFLLLGTIDKKKNVKKTLLGIAELDSNVEKEILIVGKVSDSYKEEFHSFIASYILAYPSIKLIVDDRFISSTEFHEYLLLSNIVLMVYKDFYSSSGIFGHSVLYSKPVITSSFGLMKVLVNKYGVGLTADPDSKEEIAEKIKQVLLLPSQQDKFEVYLRDNSTDAFSKQLLLGLLGQRERK